MPTRLPPRARAAAERARLLARRLQAAELFARGVRPGQVARILAVSKQSASRWHAAWERGGTVALASKGPTGVRPRLSDADLERIERALRQGAAAHGFTGDLWTLRRIGAVVERLTGVRYHVGHLWVVLHQRLGWSVQRPVRRAAERDEHAVRRWVARDWPAIKQTCECVGLRSERVAVRVRRRRCGMTLKQTGAMVAFGRAVCRGAGVGLTHRLLA